MTSYQDPPPPIMTRLGEFFQQQQIIEVVLFLKGLFAMT